MKSSLSERNGLPRGIAGLAIAMMTCASIAPAQEFPTKPARLVVPFSAGGGADLNARRLALRLENAWKQPVVVHNVAGGAGNLAAVAVAASEPDGYTMFFASLPIFITNPVIYGKLPFDPDRDFTPVILMSETPHVLIVSSTFSATTLSGLIALAKQRPGKLNFGSGGQGTSQHLAGELLKSLAGIDLVHVPYKGAAPAITAMLSDEIHMLFDTPRPRWVRFAAVVYAAWRSPAGIVLRHCRTCRLSPKAELRISTPVSRTASSCERAPRPPSCRRSIAPLMPCFRNPNIRNR